MAAPDRDESHDHTDFSDGDIPLGQRLYDRPFLLLAFGLVVMFGFYTGWGVYEILSLPHGTLP